jgi:rhodanese-related sulfurtransferase
MSAARKRHTTKSKSKSKSRKVSRSKQNFNWLWIVAGVIAVAIIVTTIILLQGGNDHTITTPPAEISVDEAYQKYEQGVYFLDVREPDEWLEYHVPNTTQIPLGELASHVDEVPKDQEIVVVCRSGNRSQQGSEILRNAGFTQVTSIAGGLNAWQDAGYPTVSGP